MHFDTEEKASPTLGLLWGGQCEDTWQQSGFGWLEREGCLHGVSAEPSPNLAAPQLASAPSRPPPLAGSGFLCKPGGGDWSLEAWGP